MRGRVRLDWLGLVLIAWSVLARALVMAEPLPGWDADPTQITIAIIGLGPTGSLTLDALAWLGAGLVFGSRKGRVFDPLSGMAILAGLCILIRAFLVDSGDVEAIRIASAWAAGWVSCAAMIAAGRGAAARSVLGAVLLSAVLLLAAKALVQVFVEHPQMLAQFGRDRAASLMAQGFDPDSTQALIYERRLRQADPTAWFGLSNVLASFAAMATVAFTIGACHLQRHARLLMLLVAVLAGFVLVLIGSKAGFGVLTLGVIAAIARRLAPARLARLAVLTLIAVPTLAVAARGLSGVPEGERSLLFRWFYANGATRVTLDHFPLGTGASGFQDAYALVKSPTATEDVTSPHMILWDYAATQGLFAMIPVSAIVWITWRVAGTRRTYAPHVASARRCRSLQPLIAAMILPPVMLGVFLESQATTIEGAVARLLGIFAWGGIAVALTRWALPTRGMLASAGFVLLAHAQLDMVLSLPGSAPLALAVIGLAAVSSHGLGRLLPRLVLPACCAIGLVLSALSLPRVWGWESLLRRSSAGLAEVIEARDALAQGSTTPADTRAIDARFREAAFSAFEDLLEAAGRMPRDPRTASEAGTMGARLAASLPGADSLAKGLDAITKAEAVLGQSLRARPRSSTAIQLGLLGLQRARLDPALADEARTQALADIERAAALAPRSARPPAILARVLSELGQPEAARLWARRAIELDDLTGLDPLSALPERERRALEGLARGP